MQFNTLKLTLLSFITATSFLGCGGGAGSTQETTSSTPNTQTETDTNKIINKVEDPLSSNNVSYTELFALINNEPDKTGLVIDAHGVEGISITCGSNDNRTHTLQNGLFTCSQLPLNLYLGTFKIGTITKLPKDKIIYTQDILNIPRAATMHPDVTKLSMILQSLDEDADLNNGINITKESIELLDTELNNFENLQSLTIEDTNNIIDNVIEDRKLSDSNVKLTKTSKQKAQINLTKAFVHTPPPEFRSNITSYCIFIENN
jgi:hypothetical protein